MGGLGSGRHSASAATVESLRKLDLAQLEDFELVNPGDQRASRRAWPAVLRQRKRPAPFAGLVWMRGRRKGNSTGQRSTALRWAPVLTSSDVPHERLREEVCRACSAFFSAS